MSPPRPSVWMLTMPGCGACAAAKPMWAAAKRTFGNRASFHAADVSRLTDWPAKSAYQVRATPTFILVLPGRDTRVWEGAPVSQAELDGWLRAHLGD